MKRGDWHFLQKCLPSKTLKQIRYKAKILQPLERRALEPTKSLDFTFNRDLRLTQVYRSTLELLQDFLSDFESDLRDSLNAQVFIFQGYTFHQDIPNYFRYEQFIHRLVPLNSMALLTQVEDMSIGHLTDSKSIDIPYVDHTWQRGEDHGKQDLYNSFVTLKNYPCEVLAICSVNYTFCGSQSDTTRIGISGDSYSRLDQFDSSWSSHEDPWTLLATW